MSFLKQILNPFVEFDENKKEAVKQNNQPVLPASTVIPVVAPNDENAQVRIM